MRSGELRLKRTIDIRVLGFGHWGKKRGDGWKRVGRAENLERKGKLVDGGERKKKRETEIEKRLSEKKKGKRKITPRTATEQSILS